MPGSRFDCISTAGRAPMLSRLRCGLAVLVVALAATASTAVASDYSHLCRSADGNFVMNDEELKTAEAERANKPGAITYRVLQTVTLGLREGYCVDNKRAEVRGKRFKFVSRSYVQRIAFTHEGQKYELDMMCELVADGMPAAYSCSQEVVTRNWRIEPRNPPLNTRPDDRAGSPPAQPTRVPPQERGGTLPAGGSRWTYRGSVVRLYADGNNRRILFDEPRDGLAQNGITPGSVLFEGERSGGSYHGRAYVYPAGCRPAAYEVRGRVSSDQRNVVLEGFAPTFSSRCVRSGLRRERLEFELMR